MIKIPTIPPHLVRNIRIQQLPGRVLELPAKPEHQQRYPILFMYGHHSSLERMYSTAQALNSYGPVIVPDLPGFGGMPSLEKIGKKPTIDNLADYLADFIRRELPKEQKFVLGGMSLGFVLAVRLLQRHPELSSRVVHLISLVGFVHHDDFAIHPNRLRFFVNVARVMAKKPTAATFDHLILRKPIIASTYHVRARKHPKMKGYSWKERQILIDFEVTLWKSNEVRTYFTTMSEMLSLDLTHTKIPMPIEHIAVNSDQYFDNKKVIQHMEQIFTEVHVHYADMPNHAPTVVEDVEAAKQMLPDTLAQIFTDKS